MNTLLAAFAFGVFVGSAFLVEVKINDVDVFPFIALAVALLALILGGKQ